MEGDGPAGPEHVEGGEQHAHECRLSGRGARGLHDIVLPTIIVLEGQSQRKIAEKSRDHGDVWTEPELKDDVGIGGAHDQRNRKTT